MSFIAKVSLILSKVCEKSFLYSPAIFFLMAFSVFSLEIRNYKEKILEVQPLLNMLFGVWLISWFLFDCWIAVKLLDKPTQKAKLPKKFDNVF